MYFVQFVTIHIQKYMGEHAQYWDTKLDERTNDMMPGCSSTTNQNARLFFYHQSECNLVLWLLAS